MLAQPTVGMPMGMPTAVGHEALRSKIRLGWAGWAGVMAVVAATLVGLWVEYYHLRDHRTQQHQVTPSDHSAGHDTGERSPADHDDKAARARPITVRQPRRCPRSPRSA